MRNRHFWALLLLPTIVWPVIGQESARRIGDFQLTDTAGKTWKLSDLKEKKALVIVFLGTQCPINNAYLPRLAELHRRFDEKGVQFLAVNSNQHDTAEAIAAHAREHAIPFPVLRDAGQKLADQLGAQRTPEAFVLDEKRKIAYHGRIDDQYGVGFQRPQPTSHDLADAVAAVLDGKKVTQPATSAPGCFITRAPRARPAQVSVTFTKDVLGILQRHCQECHRPGQIAPMPLLTYDDVSAWSSMIREVIQERRMPPWHADSKHGRFSNDRSLPKQDHDALLAWIDQGCPQGDAKDAPAPRQFPEGWTIGKPDVVFTMPREFKVPAVTPKGGVKYQNFLVPTNFAQDKWAQAIEVRPGSKATVHHILVYIAEGRKKGISADGIGKGLLGAYAPGDLGTVFPPGTAKRIPQGATLVFQVHYTPNGIEQTDRSSVGIVFAKEPPRNPVSTRAIAQQVLFIPPAAENHVVTSASTFKDETLLWSLFPHMHLRGKSFEYRAVFPDGKTQTLLSVPKYDFNWQVSYRLAEPLRMPAGSRIECRALFDNSRSNLSNPDPTKWVFWGNQTWEEMMIGFVDYTTAAPDEPIQISDRFTEFDPVDRITNNAHKVHVVKLRAGKTYLITMSRKDDKQPFHPWLRIEDSTFKQVVPDPARIVVTVRTRFTPPKDDVYRIIASSQFGRGEYVLRIAPDESAKTGVDDEGFLLRWLVLAPIPLAANETGAAAVDKEQLKNEAMLGPRAGQKVKVGDREFAWKEHVVNDYLLDFNGLLGATTEDAAAYAVAYIVAPEELKGIKLKAGSDDQLKIYLNGKEVMKFTGARAASRDQDTADVTLKKGVNVLVAKVINEKGDWGLCVRFTDKDNRPLANLQCKTAP